MAAWGEVHNYGLVDTEGEGRAAGAWLQARNVDMVFCHAATYSTSSTVLPVHQICTAPVVFLNFQPTARINYEQSTTGEWLAHCNACAVPEFANAFNRAGIPFRVVNGLLGLDYTPAISLTNEVTHERPEAVPHGARSKDGFALRRSSARCSTVALAFWATPTAACSTCTATSP